VAFPPPAIARRPDGLMLHGWCQCGQEGTSCQLIVVQHTGGLVELSFHGTAAHSIVLTPAQQEALMEVFRSGLSNKW
jgi:hypothetical protein